MTSADTSPPPAGPETPNPSETRDRQGRPWLPVLIASIIAALALLYLVLPYTLLFPADRVVIERQQPDAAALRRANAALEEEIARLEAVLQADACYGDGLILGPDGRTIPGLTLPGDQSLRPDGDSLLPAPPSRTLVPEEQRPPDAPFEGTLVDLLDQATALVLVDSPREGVVFGSGFFVAPGLLMTNHHVVEPAAGGAIWVGSQALGGMHSARLIHAEGGGLGDIDFALLEVTEARDAPFLALTPRVARLDHVVAAGYPVLVMEADASFQRLIQGDRRALPSLAVTQGVVTVIQDTGTAPVVAHTALISPGNSGGPLVDPCGRVVGQNSFGRSDSTQTHWMNYALASEALAEFLDRAGVSPAVLDSACEPIVAAIHLTDEDMPADAPDADANGDPADGTGTGDSADGATDPDAAEAPDGAPAP